MKVGKDKKTGEIIVFDGDKEVFRDKEAHIAIQWAIDHSIIPIDVDEGVYPIRGSIRGRTWKRKP